MLTSVQERQNQGFDLLWERMAWSVPLYSRGKVDAVGKQLASIQRNWAAHPFQIYLQEVLDVANNWRASHLLPLYVIRRTLERRALRINSAAIVSERIKRLPSIEKKLYDNRYRNLRLTQIEDIGGCRAVLPTIEEALALAAVYARRATKQEQHRLRNYIETPKEDGYRSIHLVYKYRSDHERYRIFNGHRIEIQIRSQLQHAWATAVEMLWTFAGIPLRMAPGQVAAAIPRAVSEIDKWRRFFVLMGSAMAVREGQPIVSGVPFDKDELRSLADQLNIQTLLPTWSIGIADLLVWGAGRGASHFLLQLAVRGDPDKKTFQIREFSPNQIQEAFDAYMLAEESSPPTKLGEPPSTNVVLVSVASLAELRSAYPNYYGDTEVFIQALKDAIT